MKHRFLPYKLSHSIVVIDITELGLTNEIFPPTGKQQMIPSLRFQSWIDVQQYFSSLGADTEAVNKTSAAFNKAGWAVLTII
jgi:hypothetical protein